MSKGRKSRPFPLFLAMCLVAFAWKAHPDYPLLISANRDEFFERPVGHFIAGRVAFMRDKICEVVAPGWAFTPMADGLC